MRKNIFLPTMAVSIALLFSCSKEKTNTTPNIPTGEETITFENVVMPKKYVQSGIVKGNGSIMQGAKKIEGLILPGDDSTTNSASIKFAAGKGQRLMFAMMFGASKDWFFASKQPGIELFDANGKPKTGKINSDVTLWDNGTKNDKTGEKEDKLVTGINKENMPEKLMELTLDYNEKTSEFTLNIKNTSEGKTSTSGAPLTTPFAPIIWAVSNVVDGKLLDTKPFFEAGKKSTKELTTLSETGNPEPLYEKVKSETGIITGLSPAIVVVYTGDKNPLYEVGKKDAGVGLKELSQKGELSKLQAHLKTLPQVKGVYIAGNAPVAPSEKVMTKIKRDKNTKVAYAFMFGYSNDWFYANDSDILITDKGDLTNKTVLFDNGTGLDQFPGAGNKQAIFGGVSEKEDKTIEKVGMAFPVPNVNQVIKVTLK